MVIHDAFARRFLGVRSSLGFLGWSEGSGIGDGDGEWNSRSGDGEDGWMSWVVLQVIGGIVSNWCSRASVELVILL